MNKPMVTFLAIFFVQAATYAQEDTASVTYIPGEDIYILQYNVAGITYTDTLVPATRIDPSVECSVTRDGEVYTFSYLVSLSLASQQYLTSFMVSHPATIMNPTKPNVRWTHGEFAQYKVWDWGNTRMDPSGLWTPTTDIAPGGSLSGFSFKSTGLPVIVNSYFEGNAPLLGFSSEPPQLLYDLLDTIVVFPYNTVVRRTLGPTAPPTPFNGLNFLDTIKSYINQSRSLGWITNQTTADKYTRLVDTARTNLQANIRAITKVKLDSVLINVNVDSSSTLTSEAYALIRFNTEYVMKKLRVEDSTFAAGNQSSSWDATAANSARHLAKSPTGQAGNYLHEVFVSGGELFYRRSTDGGSTWDQTHWINTAVGDNSRSSIATAATSSVQIVWQRKVAPSTYEVWHSYSQDNGETWSTSAILPNAGGVEVSSYQTEGAMPVIAERKEGSLVVVYCSSHGLRYRTSADDGVNWQIPSPDTISGKYNNRVRFPSLAGRGSYMYLLYDYSDDAVSPWSRTFSGTSWSAEENVGKATGAVDGAYSSVAIDANKNPIAAWSGIANTWTRSIIFRAGYTDNTWSNWFEEFGSGPFGPDWIYPSLTYYDRNGDYRIAIVNHTSANAIKLIRYSEADNSWSISTLSASGAWANITHDNYSSGNPIHYWTAQGSFPYQIVVGSSGELSPLRGQTLEIAGLVRKRRAVVYHRTLRATLALEFEPMKIATSTRDTTLVVFKRSSLRQQGIDLLTMWNYLGSDTVHVPANARRLVVTKEFTARGPSIAPRKFYLRVLNTIGIPIGLLDTTSTSGTVSVNIAPYAGMDVIFRPQVVLVGIEPPSVAVGVGNVFTVPDVPARPSRSGERSKPLRETKNRPR